MRITYVGHASYYIESAGERILCDPVLSDERVAGGLLTGCPSRVVDLGAMPPPTAIALSHIHADHFHPPSWSGFSKDVPVVIPAVERLARRIETLGFQNVVRLQDWETCSLGAVQVTATPSEAEDTQEVAFVFRYGDRSFWNTVDSDLPVAAAASLGHIEVVAAKYQPVLVQSQILLGRGSNFKKHEVKMWLEAALQPKPQLVFPAACGLAYKAGPHGFMNALTFPLTARNAVDLLTRLAPPDTRVVRLMPGDVIEWTGACYEVRSGAAAFVRCVEDDVARMTWEPFDARGLEDQPCHLSEVTAVVLPHLRDYVMPRLIEETGQDRGFFAGFPDWDVVWQLTLHLAPGERSTWSVDFRNGPPRLAEGAHDDANYFLHVAGRALVDMLSGAAGPNLFWQGGMARAYEKVFRVRSGALEFPDEPFYSVLPEFFTSMTTQRIFGIVPAADAVTERRHRPG